MGQTPQMIEFVISMKSMSLMLKTCFVVIRWRWRGRRERDEG